jgi:hypothetical protein
MANTRFQHKRSTTSGVVPTTSDIAAGELGLNLADRRIFTSNGSAVFELGANLTNLAVSGTVNAATFSVGTDNFIANSSVTRAAAFLTVPGTSIEGGHIIIGYGNNLANSIAGQSNNTFNIDVVGGNTGSTPRLRIFAQHGDGSTTGILNAANTGRLHVGSVLEQTDSTFKVTGTANVTANLTVGAALSSANLTTTTNVVTFGTAAYVVANGNVGIGTSAPGVRLGVMSSANTNDGIFYTNSNTGVSAQAVIAINTQGALGLQLGQNYSSKNAFLYLADEAALIFSTNAVARATIAANGNFGIGNNAPDARLTVTGTANVSGNVVIGGSLNAANVTATVFTGSLTGTASNATNLNSQPGSFYTNASNITTGTLPMAQLGSNVVNTTAAFTISGIHTYTANIVMGNTTVNTQHSNSTILISNSTTTTTVGLTDIRLGNSTVNTFINAAGLTTAANVLINSTGELVISPGAGIFANGSLGTAGQVLSSNGTSIYWTAAAAGVRSVSITTASTITPTADTADQYNVTALASSPATIAAPSGSPTNGQKLVIRLKDNGTGRTLNWTTTSGGYRAIGVTLPNTTVANKTTYVGCIYNATDLFWDVVASVTEA